MDSPSISDIAAVTGNENFGGSGFWIFALILVLAMMGGGFGGWGNRGNGDYGQYATAAAQQEILFGQHFGQLNDRLTNIGNGVCSLGYDMQGNIGQLGKEMALAQNATNMTVMQSANGIQSQMAEYCCAVQRGMDAINANIDAKFAALEKAQLEQRIAQLEQANNHLYIREQLTGVVRYPNGYTYNAGNSPFCGSGCGNGCC